jgi:transcriptional regulator with XRE-family HTH domain
VPRKPSKIGPALKAARLAAGLSQGDLSRLVGMSVGQISQIEAGVRKSPAFETVQRISTALHLSLDALVSDQTPTVSLLPASTREKLALRREVSQLRTELVKSLTRIDAVLAKLGSETTRKGKQRVR